MLLKPHFRLAFAEFLGTFFMVLCGTAAVIIHTNYSTITYEGVALAFGIAVMIMIYAVGEISGAHINPAVTIAFYFSGKLKRSLLPAYLIAQFSGAIFASFLLQLAFPSVADYGSTTPGNSIPLAFITEVVLTFLLMFVIINVATGSKEIGVMAGLAIGSTVAVCALIGGTISGASMNPARSLGPALFSDQLSTSWIYLTAPVVGSILAVLAWRLIKPLK